MGWFLPWLLIAAVVGVAVWLLVNALGGDEATRTAATQASPAPSVSPSAVETEPEVVVASPTPRRTPTPTPKASKTKASKKRSPKPPRLITQDINVQVLNGTSDGALDDAVAERLARLGFRIEAIDDSSVDYTNTTVFWSYPEAQEAAEILAERLGWVARSKPSNLSDTVAIHVVVGADEL